MPPTNKILTVYISCAPDITELHTLLIKCLQIPGHFNSIHLVATFRRVVQLVQQPGWTPREMHVLSRSVLPALFQQAQELLPTLDARAVAGIISSLGHLELTHLDLVDGLVHQAERKVAEFTPVGLSSLLWGLAKLSYQPSRLLYASLLSTCIRRLPEFKPKDLAIVMWACTKLDLQLEPPKLDAMLLHIQHNMAECNAHSLCLIVYALTSLGHQPAEEWLLAFVRMVSGPRLAQFSPQGLSQMLWGLARLECRGLAAASLATLCSCAADQVVQDLQAYNGADVVMVCWAFSTLGYTPKPAQVHPASAATAPPLPPPPVLAQPEEAIEQ